MFSSRSDLLERIRLGEDSNIELKEVRFAGGRITGPRQADLADEIAAFANSRGGVIVLGIHDRSKDVTGIPLEHMDAVESLFRQACEDSIAPPCTAFVERMRLPDGAGQLRPVMRIDVPRSLFVHQSPRGYLHRIGSSKRPIHPDQLARIFQQRTQTRLIRFDESPIPEATLNDLDEALWTRFRNPMAKDAPEVLLSKLAMAAQDESGVWRPTVAGVLMGSHSPERFMPNAYVQAVAYRGTRIAPDTGAAYQRDARDITGPLDRQILDTCDFVRKNMRLSARKDLSGGRRDMPQFDMLAIFESITNAVAHRDYSMAGSKVRLRMFDDRLELYSPGLLANTMTPESLPYRQAARNETLTSLLARCPIDREELSVHRTRFMDKRGEGVPLILSRSKELSGREPVYRLVDESELMLTIYGAIA